MPQYAILRFAKHKGGAQGRLEAHHERQKEKYASNPDIDTARSRLNFHLVQPVKPYRFEIDNRIAAAGCKVCKDSVKFIDTLITASPEFFKGKDGILTPTSYWQSKGIGRGGTKTAEQPTVWRHSTIHKMLFLQEYCGDVINFKTFSKSYKNKKRIVNDE